MFTSVAETLSSVALGETPAVASVTCAREPSTRKFADPPVRDHAPPVSAVPHPPDTVRPKVSAAMTFVTVTECVTLSCWLVLSVIFSVTWYVPRRRVDVRRRDPRSRAAWCRRSPSRRR